MALCQDIPSHENPGNSRIPGILNKSRGLCENPEDKNPDIKKNPEFRGFCINPGDFAKIPGIRIPKLRKIPNPGDKKPETQKINPGDFGIFHSGFFRDSQIPIPMPGILNFRDFAIQPKFKNPDLESPGSGFGIPKQSNPEANSDIYYIRNLNFEV